MNTNFTVVRDELIESLRSLITNTEEIYVTLADTYPLLLREMEESISGSDKAVSRLEGILGGDTRQSVNIDLLLSASRSLVNDAGKEFMDLHSRDDELLSVLANNIEKIAALKSIIHSIRQDSEEMELISLNAMTVAIKAGKEGGAFSYITEELKRVSERTISYTEDLTRNGNELQNLFENFKKSVNDVEQVEAQFADRFKNILDEGFDNFTRGIQESIRNARTLTEESRGVSSPLFSIMQEIQNQDIIKQSLEHVIISLEQFSPYSTGSPMEEILDEVTFLADLSSLCTVILSEVKDKLTKGTRLFQEQGASVQGLLERIERKRKEFLAASLSGKEQKERNLAVLFSSSEEIFAKLLQNIHEGLKLKEHVQLESKVLLKKVRLMSDSFQSFSFLIDRFQNINVASKIEIAKQTVLKDMRETVKEMTELTSRIEKNLDTAISHTKGFLRGTKASIGNYESIYRQEESFVLDFESSLMQRKVELNQIKDQITGIIGGFQLYTERFISLFRATRLQLEKLAGLEREMQRIIEKVDGLKRDTERNLREILSSTGNQKWEIKNSRLQEIIKGFTIYTHKKVAGEIGGFEVEGGAEEGEVTFF
jgi:hypothetical protein